MLQILSSTYLQQKVFMVSIPGWPLVQVSLKLFLNSKWSAAEWMMISIGTDPRHVSGVLINFGVSIAADIVRMV